LFGMTYTEVNGIQYLAKRLIWDAAELGCSLLNSARIGRIYFCCLHRKKDGKATSCPVIYPRKIALNDRKLNAGTIVRELGKIYSKVVVVGKPFFRHCRRKKSAGHTGKHWEKGPKVI